MRRRQWLTATRRRHLYLIALAVLPLLIAYGALSEHTAPLWAALVGTILVPGLAANNVQD